MRVQETNWRSWEYSSTFACLQISTICLFKYNVHVKNVDDQFPTTHLQVTAMAPGHRNCVVINLVGVGALILLSELVRNLTGKSPPLRITVLDGDKVSSWTPDQRLVRALDQQPTFFTNNFSHSEVDTK